MLQFQITNKLGARQFEHDFGPLEIGRGTPREQMPRLSIPEDQYVSKDHILIEEIQPGRIRMENLSSKNPVWLGEGKALEPGHQREFMLPLHISIGVTTIEIDSRGPDPVKVEMLDTIAPPVRPSKLLLAGKTALSGLGSSPSAEVLATWFETVIAVQRAAAGSPEFYAQTTQAMIDLVGLDRGLILLRRGEEWDVASRANKVPESGREYSLTTLRRVLNDRQTHFQASVSGSPNTSLRGVEAVVASPIFGAEDDIVGVLYGSRTRSSGGKPPSIGPLEAQVVQLLASAVGAGLTRLQQEAEAGRMRVQFEQFFTPDLARELQRNPLMLEGQDRILTILFSNIRGFAQVSHALTAQETCQLLREVMDEITTQVRAQEGVVAHYSGDGLMAMWNAPADQPDHATRACRAALAIQAGLPRIAEAWSDKLAGPLVVGLGLNTGMALVGNTGSEQKFKYGPLGHAVNLASRVEGATKQLGILTLMTDSTRALIRDEFAIRRLCKVRVVGMTQPVELYELHHDSASAEWIQRRDTYEKALALFETGQWSACCREVYPLLSGHEGKYDVPSLNLVSRSVDCLRAPPSEFSPIIELSSK